MTEIEITRIVHLVVFVVSLLSAFYLYGIIRKTEGSLRKGYRLLFSSVAIFSAFELSQALASFNIIQISLMLRSFVLLAFSLVLGYSVWEMRKMVVGIVSIGMVLQIFNKANYRKSVSDTVRGLNGVCYVTLKDSAKNIKKKLTEDKINISTFYFLDTFGNKAKENNTIFIKNNPLAIESALTKVLAEKKITHVVLDGIEKIKGVKDFELPRVIQNIALEARENQTQGFFISEKGSLSESVRKDINLFMDKVEEVD